MGVRDKSEQYPNGWDGWAKKPNPPAKGAEDDMAIRPDSVAPGSAEAAAREIRLAFEQRWAEGGWTPSEAIREAEREIATALQAAEQAGRAAERERCVTIVDQMWTPLGATYGRRN